LGSRYFLPGRIKRAGRASPRRRTSCVQIFACATGIFLGTVARTMPQLGLLFMLIFLPTNMLSGSNTPLEITMQASPSTHFVSFAQAILYRGAGF
jgi:hypothetical protein